jgi:hypothetical protein
VSRSSRINVGKKDMNLGKFLDRPDISHAFLDISDEARHIQFKVGHVHRTFLAAMFDDCFQCNLLTVNPIDHIFLLLAS